MFGICTGALSDWNGRPTPWNRPEQVELALDAHGVEHLVGRIVLDPDHHALASGAESRRQPAERLGRDHLELGERGRLQRPPGKRVSERIGERAVGHGRSIGGRLTPIQGCQGAMRARLTPPPRCGSVEHDPGSLPGLDPGWEPVFGQDHAQTAAMHGSDTGRPAVPGRARARRRPGAARSSRPRDPTEPAPSSSRPRRARPQIRVRPRYPYRNYHSAYPLPYDAEYPGPNAVRQCVDWYATEHRPSGTVIVPRMRCWWVPG